MSPELDALPAKQAAFVREYMVLRHQTKAYIAAGYSEVGAAANASKLIRNHNIAAAIAAEEERLRAERAPTVNKILDDYARIAFTGMSKFVTLDDDGSPMVTLARCSDAEIDLLSEISTETVLEKIGRGEDAETQYVRKVKIKTYDRLRALQKLGEHLGMFKSAKDDVVYALGELLADIQARVRHQVEVLFDRLDPLGNDRKTERRSHGFYGPQNALVAWSLVDRSDQRFVDLEFVRRQVGNGGER